MLSKKVVVSPKCCILHAIVFWPQMLYNQGFIHAIGLQTTTQNLLATSSKGSWA